jgi:sugar lactone lactonase YvrE
MKRFIYAFIALLTSFMANAQTQIPLEVVAQLSIRPGNVAVSKLGRVFATIHPLGSSNLQLIEITGKTTFKPYPALSFQKNGKHASSGALDTPLGVIFDKQDNLWVIDMGQELGKTRIWNFDIAHNRLIQKIELPESIAPKGSFIQDIAVDEQNGWAYLADIANPGIIAVNLKTKEARRFNGHKSVQSEDIDMVIDAKLTYFAGKPARVGINPVTLSNDRQTLCFGAMNGTTWYSVDAKLFRENATEAKIAGGIKKVGEKPISDGAATDDLGNYYFTNLQEHAVSVLDTDGKLATIFKDDRLLWPDNVCPANGYVYISVNQLNTTSAFTGGKDEGNAPYYIYRFKNPVR